MCAYSQYLKQEKSEEDRSGELEEVERRFSDLEEDIKHCLKQEHELEKNIASLSAQRERMARDASKVLMIGLYICTHCFF